MATAVLLLLTVIAVSHAAAPPPSSGGCTDELMSFSPCLTYVSSPPNNLTETASAACCNAFSATVNSLCFCYLLRDPAILGFPLNTTRLLSLSSVCPSGTYTAPKFLCSESPALPPLSSAQTIGITASGGGGGGGRGGGGGSRGGAGSRGGGVYVPRTGASSGAGAAAGAGSSSHGNGRNGSSSSMAGGYKSLVLSLMLTIFVTLTLSSLNTV